jgi:hypothetical protein
MDTIGHRGIPSKGAGLTAPKKQRLRWTSVSDQRPRGGNAATQNKRTPSEIAQNCLIAELDDRVLRRGRKKPV